MHEKLRSVVDGLRRYFSPLTRGMHFGYPVLAPAGGPSENISLFAARGADRYKFSRHLEKPEKFKIPAEFYGFLKAGDMQGAISFIDRTKAYRIYLAQDRSFRSGIGLLTLSDEAGSALKYRGMKVGKQTPVSAFLIDHCPNNHFFALADDGGYYLYFEHMEAGKPCFYELSTGKEKEVFKNINRIVADVRGPEITKTAQIEAPLVTNAQKLIEIKERVRRPKQHKVNSNEKAAKQIGEKDKDAASQKAKTSPEPRARSGSEIKHEPPGSLETGNGKPIIPPAPVVSQKTIEPVRAHEQPGSKEHQGSIVKDSKIATNPSILSFFAGEPRSTSLASTSQAADQKDGTMPEPVVQKSQLVKLDGLEPPFADETELIEFLARAKAAGGGEWNFALGAMSIIEAHDRVALKIQIEDRLKDGKFFPVSKIDGIIVLGIPLIDQTESGWSRTFALRIDPNTYYIGISVTTKRIGGLS